MIAPALPRWIAAVLAHPETGVNALIPIVPVGDGELMPPLVDVFNVVDHAFVARAWSDGSATPSRFVLRVAMGQELGAAGVPGKSEVDDEAIVVITLDGVAENGDNAQLLAHCYRIFRCVRRCLTHALRQLAMTPLQLEGQDFAPPAELTLHTDEPVPGSGQAQMALVAPFTMSDPWAMRPIPVPTP